MMSRSQVTTSLTSLVRQLSGQHQCSTIDSLARTFSSLHVHAEACSTSTSSCDPTTSHRSSSNSGGTTPQASPASSSALPSLLPPASFLSPRSGHALVPRPAPANPFHGSGSSLSSLASSLAQGSCSSLAAPSGGCSQLQHARGILGAAGPRRGNPQVHTHDKYKIVYTQPTYDWMRGRFILDRNDAIWHRSAGYTHKRYAKTASHLTRLKRWKPLAPAYASKLIKIGFRTKYWSPPDAHEVPGFHAAPGERPAMERWDAKPDLRPHDGDPALLQNNRRSTRQGRQQLFLGKR